MKESGKRHEIVRKESVKSKESAKIHERVRKESRIRQERLRK